MGKPPVPDRGQSDFLDCNAREPLTGGLSLSSLLHQLRQQDASLGGSSVRSGRDGKCSNKQSERLEIPSQRPQTQKAALLLPGACDPSPQEGLVQVL